MGQLGTRSVMVIPEILTEGVGAPASMTDCVVAKQPIEKALHLVEDHGGLIQES